MKTKIFTYFLLILFIFNFSISYGEFDKREQLIKEFIEKEDLFQKNHPNGEITFNDTNYKEKVINYINLESNNNYTLTKFSYERETPEIFTILNGYYKVKGINNISREDYVKDVDKFLNIKEKLYLNKEDLTVENYLLILLFLQDKSDKFLNIFLQTNDIVKQDTILVYLNKYIGKNNGVNGEIIFASEAKDLNDYMISNLQDKNTIILQYKGDGINEEIPDKNISLITGFKSGDFDYGRYIMNDKNFGDNVKVSKNIVRFNKELLGEYKALSLYKQDKYNPKSFPLHIDSLNMICNGYEINNCNIQTLLNYLNKYKDEFNLINKKDKIENDKYDPFDIDLDMSEYKDKYPINSIKDLTIDKLYYIYNLSKNLKREKLLLDVGSIIKTYNYFSYSALGVPELLRNYKNNTYFLNPEIKEEYLENFKYR